MRIIAGHWRGTRLATVGKGDPGAHLRPTPDRVRESLFSILAHKGVLDGARVLDLFAGTGALGLEALSRGASTAVFVENGRVAQRLLSENIRRLNAEDQARVIRCDATRLGDMGQGLFDIVFMDPPYGKSMGQLAVGAASAQIARGAILVWEENDFQAAPQGFTVLDQRRFGEAHITILERNTARNDAPYAGSRRD